jgi:hypothetical protein
VIARRHDDQVGLLTVDLVDKRVESVPWASMVSGVVGAHEDQACFRGRRQLRGIPERTFGAFRAVQWKNNTPQHGECPVHGENRRSATS